MQPPPPSPLPPQHDIVKMFEITQEGMKEVERRLASAFEKGLAREEDDVPVKMFVTHIHSLPDGSEQGSFLGLDIGGSHISILLISKLMHTLKC